MSEYPAGASKNTSATGDSADPLDRAERLSAELCSVLKTLPPAEQLLVLRSLSDKIDASIPLSDRERRRNRLALTFSGILLAAGGLIYLFERSHGSNGMTGGTVAVVGLFLLAGALSPYLTELLKRH